MGKSREINDDFGFFTVKEFKQSVFFERKVNLMVGVPRITLSDIE